MALDDIVKTGRVAVVTGAASGIGKAACCKFAEVGMSVCLVDLPGDALNKAFAEVASLHPQGEDQVAVFAADLAAVGALTELASAVMKRFGPVHLLMNNAVTRTGRGNEASLTEWREAMEVNFWAVVEAVRAFLPTMHDHGAPGMIVNVGSKQGITNPPGHPIYNATKAALKSYTETLEHDLRGQPERTITAHLLIPGWTTTGTSDHKVGAWLPDQVIDFMLEGLVQGDFYILCPDDEVSTERDHRRIAWAAEDIIQNRVPLSRWHPKFEEEAKNHC